MKRTLIYTDDKSNKFWSIEMTGNSYTVNYGKVGTTGQTQAKEFADEATCRKALEKLIAEKIKKGYIESTQESEPVAVVSKVESITKSETNKNEIVIQEAVFTYDDVEFYVNDEAALKRGAELVEKNNFTKRQMSADQTVLSSDCKGSKSSVYECYIDMADPVQPKGWCNCPSRQRPCKHMIGLLLSKLNGQPFDISSELVSTVKPAVPKKTKAKKGAEVSSLQMPTSGPEPLADDNKPKVWQDDDKLWDYYSPDYEEFEIDRLENISEDNDDDQTEPELEKSDGEEMSRYDELVELYGKKDVDDILRKACWKGDIDNMEFLWNIFITDERYAHIDTGSTLTGIYRNYLLSPNLDDNLKVPTIEWLLKTGVNYDPSGYDEKGLISFFGKEYQKDPRPERTREILNMYVDAEFRTVKESMLKLFYKYIEALRSGKTEEKNINYLPEGGFKEDCFGFSMWYGLGSINVRVMQTDVKRIFEIENRKIKKSFEYFGSWFMRRHIVPALEKMIGKGEFDTLFPSGLFAIVNEDTHETVFKHEFDDKALDRFESYIKDLETGELQTSRISLKFIFNTIRYGNILKADEERAFGLLRRYLYSGDEDAESSVLFIMKRLTDEYSVKDPRALYELALWHKANVRLNDALRFMQEAIVAGHEPAKELEKILQNEDAIRKILLPPMQRRDSVDIGFNLYAARQEWAATFEAGFTEEDLFVRTENIIGRARKCGSIYIRFLIEGEQGYSEALDFINNLLGKGYAVLSKGYAKGFSLDVYFVRKPDFIPQLKNSRFDSARILYPRSSCHAFFARAVQYPALREKVVGYVERSMIEYHWYLDLVGEANTIPGTFAVSALAFCGPEYFYLVEKYAQSVDADHTYIQNCLSRALVKHYGGDLSTAVILYELAGTVGQTEALPFSTVKHFIWSAPFLKAILEHIKDRSPQALSGFCIPAAELFGRNIKRNLTQFRSMWRGATDPEEKRIIAEFNDLYLSAMSIHDSADCEGWKPLTTTDTPVSEPKQESTLAEILDMEDQSSVITIDEAKVRGLEILDGYKKRTMVLFSPACITNIEDAAYVKSQWREIGTENSQPMEKRRCYMLIGYNYGAESFGDWVVDGEKLEYEYGVIFYDGKNKPVILFGQFDCLAMGIEYTKRKISTAEDYLILRDKYLLKESPVARKDKEFIDASNFFENCVGGYFSAWKQYSASLELIKIDPQPHPLAYLSSRVMLAHFAEMQVNFADMFKYYSELKELQPEKSDYWQRKIEFAKKLKTIQ